jgi:hypothetical protein
MRGTRIAGLLGLLALIAVAALAGSAAPASGGTARAVTAQSANSVQVRFAVTKFAARGKHLVAIGQAITTYQSTDGQVYSSAKPFAANVQRIHAARTPASARTTQSATRICDVLNLNLGPLHLELLGLIVDLNQVVLTIKADSNGGLLGSLLCGLAGTSGAAPTALTTTAAKLTKVAHSSGLAAGPAFNVPLQLAAPGTQQAAAVCTVLDLTLGPLDLNLLGLMVHLGGGATGTDPIHLTITADPTKGILGSLLCSLAGGLPTG